ncbi:hypothetical protein [Pseudomonas sp. GM80]|uniref:hypothetical protein n=1 Tax=Pseudomonas sp. GM80 TaxID=1144339 RepID=UPI000696989E|nr:hypothetical protein [Pseudomonas sp. GM80]
MTEKVKRLQPLGSVLRELYLKSGNECAFPECEKRIMAANGDFIGQLCHIEAAEEGGQRFNVNGSNAQRRTFQNLLLMCYEHHVVTNDTSIYDVAAMRKIKSTHEEKYSNVVAKIQQSSNTDIENGAPILIKRHLDTGTQKESRYHGLAVRQATPALATFEFECTYGGSASSKILNHTEIFTKIDPVNFEVGDTVTIIADLHLYDEQYLFSPLTIKEPLRIACITKQGKKAIIELEFDGYKVEQRL